jgi:hypothetical protein
MVVACTRPPSSGDGAGPVILNAVIRAGVPSYRIFHQIVVPRARSSVVNGYDVMRRAEMHFPVDQIRAD